MADSTNHQIILDYFAEVWRTTWTISKEYWVAVAIAWIIAPIADILIYTSHGRATASEWTYSSVMTDKIPFTIFVILLTVLLILVCSPYRLWRDKQRKILSLQEQINNKPELSLEYDTQSCLKITGSKYLFHVVVSSKNASVPGVIIGVEAFVGMDGFGHLNRPFRFKHYPDNGQVTCNIGEKVSVNILFLEKGEKGSVPNAGRLQLLFQGDAVLLNSNGPFNMTLRATGGIGALPDYKTYRIGVRDDIPFMESVSS
jgi:hypothetical protein